jgi:hypothetical protein
MSSTMTSLGELGRDLDAPLGISSLDHHMTLLSHAPRWQWTKWRFGFLIDVERDGFN